MRVTSSARTARASGFASLRFVERGEPDARFRRIGDRRELRLELPLGVGLATGSREAVRKGCMKVSNDGERLEPFGLDGSLEVPDGFVAPRVLLRDDAEQVVAHVPRRIDLQAAPRVSGGLVCAAGVHHQLGENLVALSGIAPASQFGMLTRQRRLALERVDARQREMRLGFERVDLDRLSECRDGVLRPAGGDERLRQRFPAVHHPRVRREDLPIELDGFRGASGAIDGDRPLQRFERGDLIFRIGQRVRRRQRTLDEPMYPSAFSRSRTSAGAGSGSAGFAPSVVRAIHAASALAVPVREAARFCRSPGSFDRSYSSGIGARMYLNFCSVADARSLQPRCRRG